MTALSGMRDHDANEELRYIREGRRLNVGWSWLWLAWEVGVSVYLDPTDKPGLWLQLGPLVVGGYWDTERGGAA